MQFQSDPFLGWTTIASRDYLVRQLNDHKGSLELEDLAGEGLLEYAAVCGELLARGHARAGDPCVLAGYIGTGARFDDAIARFAAGYADQTEKDWEELKIARKAPAKKCATEKPNKSARKQVKKTCPQRRAGAKIKSTETAGQQGSDVTIYRSKHFLDTNGRPSFIWGRRRGSLDAQSPR